MRRFSLALLVLGLLASIADPSEAQQRRSHRRRPRPSSQAAAEPAEPSTAPEGQPTSTPADAPPAGAASPASAPAPSASATAPAAAVPATSTAQSPVPSGGASAAPAPAVPPPSTDFGDTPPLPDLAAARAEYEAIMNELVETRSRVAVLGQQLFDTQVRVRVVDRARREQDLVELRIALDGTSIFDAEPTGERDEPRQVFEGFAAPGPHALSVSVERRSRGDEQFRTSRDETFRFVVIRGKITEITILLNDRSDAARTIETHGHGEFDVRTRVQIATLEREAR